MSRVLLLVASIAWLGGLFRLAGEALAALVTEAGPRVGQALPFLVFGVVILAVEVVLMWHWPWFRGLLRQTNADFRVYYGLPADPGPKAEPSRGPAAVAVALIVAGALIVAVLLPGPFAAAIALLAGLVLRVGVVVVAARGP